VIKGGQQIDIGIRARIAARSGSKQRKPHDSCVFQLPFVSAKFCYCFASAETGGIGLREVKSGRRGLWSETLKKERRHWSADDKIKLLRLHLIEKQAISKICEDASLSPTQFYDWQEQLFTNGGLAMVSKRVPERNKDLERIEKLEGRLRQKDEVIAELLTEHIALKKEFGDL